MSEYFKKKKKKSPKYFSTHSFMSADITNQIVEKNVGACTIGAMRELLMRIKIQIEGNSFDKNNLNMLHLTICVEANQLMGRQAWPKKCLS